MPEQKIRGTQFPTKMENIIVYSSGKVRWRGKVYRAALGKNGVSSEMKEGNEATPIGCFPIREIFYRADRLELPKVAFPSRPLAPEDGWCDDLKDEAYNKFVKLPYLASHEKLWGEDNLYDIIVVLGYNDEPVIPGKGSAIFMHITWPNYSPTAGCIALSKEDLLEILTTASKETQVCVQN